MKLLNMWRGKKVMFVGDSLVVNQYESLLCMLHAAAPGARTNQSWASGENPSITVRFEVRSSMLVCRDSLGSSSWAVPLLTCQYAHPFII